MGPTEKRRALVLADAMGAWAWNMGLRVGVPAILPFVRERYSFTTAEASTIPAALMVPTAIALSSVIAFLLSDFPSGSRSSF
jgi:hypothetical protein